jgi:hypothetical protein
MWAKVSQVSDVAHGPLVSDNFLLDCKTSGSMCLTLLLKLTMGRKATELVTRMDNFKTIVKYQIKLSNFGK